MKTGAFSKCKLAYFFQIMCGIHGKQKFALVLSVCTQKEISDYYFFNATLQIKRRASWRLASLLITVDPNLHFILLSSVGVGSGWRRENNILKNLTVTSF